MGDNGHSLTPMKMQLQDEKRTKVLLVTLPETTPVLEAAILQEDLRRAGIEPWAWLINNSLAAAATSSPLLQLRAAHEVEQIKSTRHIVCTLGTHSVARRRAYWHCSFEPSGR